MLRIAVLEIYPTQRLTKSNMIDAHMRNAVELGKILGADVLACQGDYIRAYEQRRTYDVFILNYSSGYMPFAIMEKVVDLSPDALRVRLSNEYDHSSSWAYFTRKPFEYISNFEVQNVNTPTLRSWNVLNLNLLLAGGNNGKVKKQHDVVYYGTFRPDRSLYFKRYLHKPMYVSTSPKNIKRFHGLGCRPTFIDKMQWARSAETLNLFKYSLYIEDEYTHTCFNHMANRFYEGIRCNTVMLFDSSCMNTISKSGYIIHERQIVHSLDDIQALIADEGAYDELLEVQNKNIELIADEKRQFAKDINSLIRKLYEQRQR